MFFNKCEVTFLDNELEDAVNASMSGEMKAYLDGYACGLTWSNSWEPGGPWIYTAKTCGLCVWTCREQISKMRQDQRENLAWRTGWKNGVEDKRSKK